MKSRVLGLSAALLCAVLAASPVIAQSTEFTYQGKLELSGAAVNGTADFQFRLFTSLGGSTQVGSTQSISNMSVADGVFTVPLNFGASAFNGEDRYLEIAVRSPANTGNFVILTPRQKLTAAPYARFAAGPWVTNGTHLTYSAGAVGIGTSTPTSLLEIAGAQDALKIRGPEPKMLLTDSAFSDGRVLLQNSQGRFFVASESFLTGANTSGFTMVDSQGRLGIGTFTPTSKVEIAAQDGLAISGFQPFLTLRDTAAGNARALVSSGNGDLALWTDSSIPTGFPPVFLKNSSEYLGVGDVDPQFRLELDNIANTDGRARANQWVTYSSIRWKDNVHTLDNALDTIMQLRGVSFDWKAEHGGGHDIGFVAEEVGAVVPEIVSWEADGQWAQGLAYDRVTALAVEAIKEQQTQIEDLQQANEDLRQQIANLMHLVAAATGAPASE